ncbi:Small glutamine-rich tetratricopeptide repeat-containing protein alpha [Heracleum sosnowskyi]|uniref:Small glutamine-rich tetratricopeptide repeat-containing protein alpha n=1 Tax=Heracleum sosnowskyi TaxID=360622 RepID=A0AAD8MVI0_9APIA|nr:Small glutamine-rich tetratricopeptide repeat-containing protein alpha [Heracleum sosnowskyi]
MSKISTDSNLSKRIVHSFLQFLNSVEPSTGVDPEALEVAKECLSDVFKINHSIDSPSNDSLVEIFRLRESTEQRENKSNSSHNQFSTDVPSTSAALNKETDRTGEAPTQGISKDEIFGQFFDALEKARFFKTMPDGTDDEDQLDRATRTFHSAIEEMEKSGCQTYDRKNLAEILKSQGNKAMQLKQYTDAIELYTFAIALYEDSAVYYCNRAAAYTQINKYTEAIGDCLRSIEIDPNYGKAYSRLGFAYYAQGNYRDAIDKGFSKALQLDPTNESVKENIRAAEQKLREEYRRAGHYQYSSSSSHQRDPNYQSAGGSRSDGTVPPQFTSVPLTANGIPIDIGSLIRNMTSNYQDMPQGDSNNTASPDADIRIGGNINVNLGDQMPEELSGALRSVMEMFSGTAPPPPPPPHGNSQDNMRGNPGQS